MVVNGDTAKVLGGELELEAGLLGDDLEDADGLVDDLGAWS